MIEYGYRSPDSSMIVTAGSYDDAHDAARGHAASGHDVELVRVELVGTYRAGVGYAPASRTCYLCGKDREGRSVECPGKTHR